MQLQKTQDMSIILILPAEKNILGVLAALMTILQVKKNSSLSLLHEVFSILTAAT